MLAKSKSKEAGDPESLKRINLLRLRQVRDLRREIQAEQEAELRLFRSKVLDSSLAELEDVRGKCRSLQDEFTMKEFCAKEKKLQAVDALVQAKAASSKKNSSRLVDELIRDQAKVEREYEHSLLKQINSLKRQQLDVKLRNIQYNFTSDELLGKSVEKELRQQKQNLQQLELALTKYQNVDLLEASALIKEYWDPQPEVETDQIDGQNKELKEEIKILSRSLKRETRAVDRLVQQLVEEEETESDLNKEINAYDLPEYLRQLQGALEQKLQHQDKLRSRLEVLGKMDQDQEEEFAGLVDKKNGLTERCSFDEGAWAASETQAKKKELSATDQAIRKSEIKLIELVEEKKRLVHGRDALKTELGEVKRKQPHVQELTDEEQRRELKTNIKELQRQLNEMRNIEAQLYQTRALKQETFNKLKASVKSESERLEFKRRQQQRHQTTVKEAAEKLKSLRRMDLDFAARAKSLVLELEHMTAEMKNLGLEEEGLAISFREAAKDGLALRKQLEQAQRSL